MEGKYRLFYIVLAISTLAVASQQTETKEQDSSIDNLAAKSDSEESLLAATDDVATVHDGMAEETNESNEKADEYSTTVDKRGENSRPKYDPGLRFLGLGKRGSKPKYDPGMKFMGLGKRQRQRPKYDPGLKFIGLGKRNPSYPNEIEEFAEEIKRGGSVSKYDPGLKFLGLGKRQRQRPKYDPAMRYMGLGKREDPNVEYEEEMSADTASRVDAEFVDKRGKPKYDPGMRYMGLGKRVSDNDIIPVTNSDFTKKSGGDSRPKYDPGLRFLGLGKRQRQRPKYDPAMNFMGLGKRSERFQFERNSTPDASFYAASKAKRSMLQRPRFDPGWKFIGLGKRSTIEGDEDAATNGVRPLNEGSLKHANPYLGVLALQNLSLFFEEYRNRLKNSPSDHEGIIELGSSEEEWSPLFVPNSENGGGNVYVRSRKPSGATNIQLLKGRTKPLYDPGWQFTGLGK